MNVMKDSNPIIKCADGFAISVQADHSRYCTPREDYPNVPYTHVECGYPSSKPVTEALLDYAEMCGTDDYRETVYGYVPVEVVEAELDNHGGITEGCLPSAHLGDALRAGWYDADSLRIEGHLRPVKFIGLSLSLCVNDICEGRVPLDCVEGIVPGFVIGSENTLEDVFDRYKDVYWSQYPDKAKEVLWALTLLTKHADGVNIAAGHWVRAEDYSPDLVEFDRLKLHTEDVSDLIITSLNAK
jgi:hypothetical protein